MPNKPTILPPGSSYGRLTILSRNPRGTKSYYLCQCSCGNQHTAYVSDIVNGNTKSCGCLRREILADARSKIDHSKAIKHGMHGTPTYYSWASMLSRCRHPEKTYLNGKNIKVCDQWNSFSVFFADMGERPKGLSLDREDNNGNYEPGNCRWATRSEQNKNQRKVKKGEMRKLCNFSDDELLAEVSRRTLVAR